MTVKLLTEQHLELLNLTWAEQARLSLVMSKCHIAGNHMSWFIWYLSHSFTLNATKVVCFSRLLKCLSLYGKQCCPRSDCSYIYIGAVYSGSTLFASILSNARQLFATDDIFKCLFFGALRVKDVCVVM